MPSVTETHLQYARPCCWTLQLTISDIMMFIKTTRSAFTRLSQEISAVQANGLRHHTESPFLVWHTAHGSEKAVEAAAAWGIIFTRSRVRNHAVNFTRVTRATLNHIRQFNSGLPPNQCFCCRNWIGCRLWICDEELVLYLLVFVGLQILRKWKY